MIVLQFFFIGFLVKTFYKILFTFGLRQNGMGFWISALRTLHNISESYGNKTGINLQFKTIHEIFLQGFEVPLMKNFVGI